MNPVVSALRLFGGFSYKEKSLLISLVALLAIYGSYFAGVLSGAGDRTFAALLDTMIGLVITLVVVHVVFHIVISLDDVEEAEDERDRAVRRRAAVLGYNVLFVGVLLITGRLLVLGAMAPEAVAPEAVATASGVPETVVPMSQMDLVNLLLAAMVASEVVFYAAQLCFYRLGLRD